MKRFLIIIQFIIPILIFGQDITAELTQIDILGDDESRSHEYLFKFPQQLCTDSEHNIYIVDSGTSYIQMFDENFKFIKKIGKSGQGPGEIGWITCMTVNSNDEIVIGDRFNNRLSIFGKDHVNVTSLSLQGKEIPSSIDYNSDSTFILQYLKNPIIGTSKLFHMFSKNLTVQLADFAELKLLQEINQMQGDIYKSRMTIGDYHLAVLTECKLIVVPEYYNGFLTIYKQDNLNYWFPIILKGKKPKHEPLLKIEDGNVLEKKFPFPTVQGGFGNFGILNSSLGVFFLRNGHIVHLAQIFEKRFGGEYTSTLSLEVFNNKGELLGCCPVKHNLTTSDHGYALCNILWKDKSDIFYFSDARLLKDYAVIRKMELKYTIEE